MKIRWQYRCIVPHPASFITIGVAPGRNHGATIGGHWWKYTLLGTASSSGGESELLYASRVGFIVSRSSGAPVQKEAAPALGPGPLAHCDHQGWARPEDGPWHP